MFTASTTKVYAVPAVSPVTTYDRVDESRMSASTVVGLLFAPLLKRMRYPTMGLPPSSTTLPHERVTRSPVELALRLVGANGFDDGVAVMIDGTPGP